MRSNFTFDKSHINYLVFSILLSIEYYYKFVVPLIPDNIMFNYELIQKKAIPMCYYYKYNTKPKPHVPTYLYNTDSLLAQMSLLKGKSLSISLTAIHTESQSSLSRRTTTHIY